MPAALQALTHSSDQTAVREPLIFTKLFTALPHEGVSFIGEDSDFHYLPERREGLAH